MPERSLIFLFRCCFIDGEGDARFRSQDPQLDKEVGCLDIDLKKLLSEFFIRFRGRGRLVSFS